MTRAGEPASLRREAALTAGGLVLASFGIVMALLLGERAARIQREWAGQVTQILDIRGATYALRASLADMERWQRLYVLGGDAADLGPFYEAAGAARERIARIRELARDNPVQRALGEALAPLVARRVARLDSVIAVRRARGFEAARQAVLNREWLPLADSISAHFEAMRQAEDSLLQTRQASWDAAVRRRQRIQTVTVVVTIGFMAAALAVFARFASARRRAQEERDRGFLLSQDLICRADFEGRFVELNPAWERTLGYSLDEILGRPFLELVHPDDRERTAAESQRQEREGTHTIHFVNRYRHRDGSYRVLQWSATPNLAERMVYATARDITPLHEAEEELRRSEERSRLLNEELQQSVDELTSVNQELEAFTYSVSHDLRAPLRHISGFSELLERHVGGALDEKGKRYLGTIGAAVVRMGMLIDDLLMFSRIGRGELHAGPVRLDDVVQAVLPELGQEIARRKVRLELRPLPVVHGDSALLQVVFANLLSNALKYTRPREEPRVEVGTDAARDGRVVVFVRDNGVGFDMQYVGKLFGVFQRLHSPEEFEGTGIGLATVQRIVHKHAGLVWAEGAVEKGATFYVALPPADPTSAPGVT